MFYVAKGPSISVVIVSFYMIKEIFNLKGRFVLMGGLLN